MKHLRTTSAFTLIELIISVTIFGIIMVSVVSIFLFASQMSTRVELNRAMQESIKNVLEDIAEWVRKEGIEWVVGYWELCGWTGVKIGTDIGLCLLNGDMYKVGYLDEVSWDFQLIGDLTECVPPTTAWSWTPKTCRIIKQDALWDYYPMTNNFLSFTDVDFTVIESGTDPKKLRRVIVRFVVQPAYKQWLTGEIIQASTKTIQTTISERLISTK